MTPTFVKQVAEFFGKKLDNVGVEIKGAELITIKGERGEKGEPGEDSTVPGPQGIQGKEGPAGPPGKDGKDSIVPGPQGIQGEPGKDGKDGPTGPAGKDGSPDTGEDIVDKINKDKSKKVIKKEHVEGLSEIEDAANTAKANSQDAMRLRAGVLYLNQLLDVDVSGITAGQSIQWDGSRWIPFTPVGGTTSIFEEVPTDSGDHINFTLAHTPDANGIRLYRGGARQQPGAGKDYTLSGSTITLTTALNTAVGEVMVADYVY